MIETPSPRLRTRDLLAPSALFLGALLLAGAIALGPVVGASLKKIPLDVDLTWVADGSDGSRVLNRCSIDEPRAQVLAAQVQQRRRIVAVRPADSDVVTLQAGTSLGVSEYRVDGEAVDADDVCDTETLSATVDRVTIDRRTALPSGQPSEIQYDDTKGAVTLPDRKGFTYVLPFEFSGSDLTYFDIVSRTPVPLIREGTQTVAGRETVHLAASVDDADLSRFDTRAVITRPASWFGSFRGVRPDEPLTAALHHSAQRDLFVDETTGVVVEERVRLVEEYRFTSDTASRSPELADFRLTNVDTTLHSDPQSLQDAADAASSRDWPVTLTTLILPIVFGVLGIASLVFGVAVTLRDRRNRP
ncbi:porin PorA family protein [Gordonia liuliyuniae]|uniref:DUF3068 domain-containing protein n=1 Tax=Gordonia liuliyuniae TaxID=2911517 RepID=A0ABS9IT87_9ACTN|nr:porin PorA family protein [Gordonia liuliyuniae]MCF8588769.1 DUF3068 domain-containing protein [Gordonia liuliyuniae]